MPKRLIYVEDAIEALHDEIVRRRIDENTNDDGALDEFDTEAILRRLPSAQPQDIARDIATIIDNEKDMRVVLKNAEPQWIPVTKEEMLKAGYEGREIRFRVDGRLFAIRELAQ